MATRTIDRLLLIPALIVLGSVTLAGCSLLPGGAPSPSSSSSDSSSGDESSDEEATDDADEATGSSDCPDSLSESTAAMAGADGTVTFIEPVDFAAPVVGVEFLDGGCLFRVEVETEGVPSSTDIGYLPGDAATVATISANLEAGGYTKVADGIFTLSDNSGVFVFASEDMMSATEVEQLGMGDSIVVVMATTTGE